MKEYKVNRFGSTSEAESYINRMVKDGWKLFSVSHGRASYDSKYCVVMEHTPKTSEENKNG